MSTSRRISRTALSTLDSPTKALLTTTLLSTVLIQQFFLVLLPAVSADPQEPEKTTLSNPNKHEEPSSNGNGTTTEESPGVFGGMDRDVLMRASIVVFGLVLILFLYFAIKVCRRNNRKDGIRKYDVLSAKQLQPDLIIETDEDEDSEEDIYDDSHKKLVNQSPSK